jgi:hypothetical protein
MPDLQDVGMQRIAVPRQEPVLLRTLGVADEQHANPTDLRQHDCAREIRIREPNGPRRIGPKKVQNNSVDHERVTRVDAFPGSARLTSMHERRSIRVRGSGKRGIEVVRRMHRGDDRRGAANMIRVWMREDECHKIAALARQVGEHDGAPRVSAAPCGSSVNEDPAPVRRP